MPNAHQVVCRVQPVKNTLALMGVEKHDKRIGASKKDTHDATRTHLNETLYGGSSLFDDTMKVVGQYKKAHTKSALAGEVILTANKEWFDKISPKWREGIYTKEFIQWRDLTVKFLTDSYPGVAHIALHMDEQSPHVHAVVVPVHTKTIGFRRGEKEVTRIRYNDVFGDTMQVLVAARKAGNSELTKLGQLQTAYANAMKPTGLKRGISNKKIYHADISEYQQRISTPTAELEKYEKPPVLTAKDKTAEMVGIETENLREAARIKAKNLAASKQNQKLFKQMEAKSRDYDRMKKDNEIMKNLLIEKDEKLAAQGAAIRAAADATEVTKRLRGLDINEVAERIGATVTKADRNAIDLLKNHAGFTYEESLAWLSNEYDADTAKYEAGSVAIKKAERITSVMPEQPMSPLDAATGAQVKRQLDALGASNYRITLQVADSKATEALHTYNMGKGKGEDGKELFYTQDSITKVIPFLRRENTRGYNIIITPLDDEKLYLLVDDLTDESLVKMKAEGYEPNVLQSTSKKSMQAVFVLPKQDVSEPSRNELFNELNGKYGDPKITGYTHGFRLAGFTNAKPKHVDERGLRPIVRVLHSAMQTCGKAVAWCKEFMSATAMPRKSAKQAQADAQALYAALDTQLTTDLPAPSQAASAKATQFYAWIASRYGVDVDMSRADYMLAERMAGSFTKQEIASTLMAHSPGIAERHTDVMRYVNGTVSNSMRPS